jgi:hypothetical protein
MMQRRWIFLAGLFLCGQCVPCLAGGDKTVQQWLEKLRSIEVDLDLTSLEGSEALQKVKLVHDKHREILGELRELTNTSEMADNDLFKDEADFDTWVYSFESKYNRTGTRAAKNPLVDEVDERIGKKFIELKEMPTEATKLLEVRVCCHKIQRLLWLKANCLQHKDDYKPECWSVLSETDLSPWAPCTDLNQTS